MSKPITEISGPALGFCLPDVHVWARTWQSGVTSAQLAGVVWVNLQMKYHWARGVVVSHPLSMRAALGSIPSVAICGYVDLTSKYSAAGN